MSHTEQIEQLNARRKALRTALAGLPSGDISSHIASAIQLEPGEMLAALERLANAANARPIYQAALKKLDEDIARLHRLEQESSQPRRGQRALTITGRIQEID